MTRRISLLASREIFSHHAREFFEDLAERHHAHVEDALLQFVEAAAERAQLVVQRARELRLRAIRLHAVEDLLEAGARDGQLADDVHQVIELADVDADGLRDRFERQLGGLVGDDGRRGGRRGRGRRRGDGRRRGRERRRTSLRRFAAAARDHVHDRGHARDGGGDLVGRSRRAEHHVELDLLIARRLRRRQIGDHLADGLEPRLELVEPLVDRHQVERRVNAIKRSPRLDVLAQPVLFVLGQDRQQPRVEIVAAERRLLLLGRLRGGHAIQPLDQIVDGDRRLARARARRRVGDDAIEQRHRLEQEIERLGFQLEAPEAQRVEQVLEVVREAGHARDAEEAREPLQRVHRAKRAVQDLGIVASLRARLVERQQIAVERLDDLLRFGEELLKRFLRRGVAHASPLAPPEQRSLSIAFASQMLMRRARR